MMTLETLRESAVQMISSQMGKDKRYNTNETSIGFIEGVTLFILPKNDIYEKFIEEKGYVYDPDIYIPPIDF